jgi:ferritin-like protein
MASEGFHEAVSDLTPQTLDMHRAIVSLMEELEAIDWYQQRVDATRDEALRTILVHNRDEEKEHASMVLEWIRRHDPTFDAHLRKYLFTTLPITERGAQGASATARSLKNDTESAEPQPVGGKRWNG